MARSAPLCVAVILALSAGPVPDAGSIPVVPPLRQYTILPTCHPAGSGLASWYGPGFHGRLTASGSTYDQDQLSAAHRSLPLRATVRVTRRATGQAVLLRVTDRGPYVPGRVLDLSRAAARRLGMERKGLAHVTLDLCGG